MKIYNVYQLEMGTWDLDDYTPPSAGLFLNKKDAEACRDFKDAFGGMWDISEIDVYGSLPVEYNLNCLSTQQVWELVEKYHGRNNKRLYELINMDEQTLLRFLTVLKDTDWHPKRKE